MMIIYNVIVVVVFIVLLSFLFVNCYEINKIKGEIIKGQQDWIKCDERIINIYKELNEELMKKIGLINEVKNEQNETQKV